MILNHEPRLGLLTSSEDFSAAGLLVPWFVGKDRGLASGTKRYKLDLEEGTLTIITSLHSIHSLTRSKKEKVININCMHTRLPVR
jgi:hypothetical protein